MYSNYINPIPPEAMIHFITLIVYHKTKLGGNRVQKTLAESVCYHFFPISEFSYKLIRFLLHRSIVKSDNVIGECSYEDI